MICIANVMLFQKANVWAYCNYCVLSSKILVLKFKWFSRFVRLRWIFIFSGFFSLRILLIKKDSFLIKVLPSFNVEINVVQYLQRCLLGNCEGAYDVETHQRFSINLSWTVSTFDNLLSKLWKKMSVFFLLWLFIVLFLIS